MSPNGQNGNWKVKSEGASKPARVFDTQKEAVKYGISQAKAKQSELIVQRPDGRIRSKDSYGKDPCPPKDREH